MITSTRTTLAHRIVAAGAAAALGASLTACGGGGGGGSANTIDYWMWDASQVPGYQKCADAFERKNRGLKIRITQYGWGDYWSKLTAGFIADTAPDVFVNHVTKYPQFVDLKVLRPLDELGPTKSIKASEFQPGLAAIWKGKDGLQYGSPKDWDTVGLFYDKAAVRRAGISERQMNTLNWNPKDGGTFEKVVRRLTVDTRGKRADQPGFNRQQVKTYGFASAGGGGDNWGQTQWSPFTADGGWQALNRNPWGTKFRIDNQKMQRTIDWYFGLTRKGLMPGYESIGGAASVGNDKQIQTGQAAIALNGSWMIGAFMGLQNAKGKKLEIGLAPTPMGPSGKRASMLGGLADSITTQASNPDAAARWVKFLSGAECQNIIGDAGVVFPARASGTERAVAYNKTKRKLDVAPFTDHLRARTTFGFPVTSNSADVSALLKTQFDAIYIGSERADSLTPMNTKLDDLLRLAD
jgi:multiple sugar transport system substrate-binding protein